VLLVVGRCAGGLLEAQSLANCLYRYEQGSRSLPVLKQDWTLARRRAEKRGHGKIEGRHGIDGYGRGGLQRQREGWALKMVLERLFRSFPAGRSP